MKTLITTIASFALLFSSCSQAQNRTNPASNNMEEIAVSLNLAPTDTADWNELTPEETRVIVNKGTEYPHTGEYVENHSDGVYQCKRCNQALFLSESKFDSGTGWPSFDDYLKGAVKQVKDADGYREEIVCSNCEGHLGHVFHNEGFTKKNTRHCVNSISLSFVTEEEIKKKEIKN